MGFSLSWLAVRGKSREDILAELRLTGTGQFEEMAESPLVGAHLPGGWYLVVDDHSEKYWWESGTPRALSAGCEVVFCMVEEHVMYSVAHAWKDGQQLWAVEHDCEKGLKHLDVQGGTPSFFDAMRTDLLRKQEAAGEKARVDYVFDGPVDLAFAVTGYRHDHVIEGMGDTPFEVLEETE